LKIFYRYHDRRLCPKSPIQPQYGVFSRAAFLNISTPSRLFGQSHDRQMRVIRLYLIQVLCCFYAPRHIAYRSWSSPYAHLLLVTVPHPRGTLTSLLLPLNFPKSLSQDAVVVASHTQHLCPSREQYQQQEHFSNPHATARLTVQFTLLTTLERLSQSQGRESKSTAQCEKPGGGLPTR
jgi:hypothetical protein